MRSGDFAFDKEKGEYRCPNGKALRATGVHFAHLKTHHRFERMRLRGLTGGRDEFHLAAIVQNLKTFANHSGCPPASDHAR